MTGELLGNLFNRNPDLEILAMQEAVVVMLVEEGKSVEVWETVQQDVVIF